MKAQSISLILLSYLAIFITSCRERGCTDQMAINYNPQARLDDRSCSYIGGCTDCLAINYDSNAVSNNGTCQYELIDHLGTYLVTDSLISPDLSIARDTYDITFKRDTCGAFNVIFSNYANLNFSDSVQVVEVSAQIFNDTLYVLPQILNGPTNIFANDYYSIDYMKGYFRNDSVFLTISYSDRYDPYWGFLIGVLK